MIYSVRNGNRCMRGGGGGMFCTHLLPETTAEIYILSVGRVHRKKVAQPANRPALISVVAEGKRGDIHHG